MRRVDHKSNHDSLNITLFINVLLVAIDVLIIGSAIGLSAFTLAYQLSINTFISISLCISNSITVRLTRHICVKVYTVLVLKLYQCCFLQWPLEKIIRLAIDILWREYKLDIRKLEKLISISLQANIVIHLL